MKLSTPVSQLNRVGEALSTRLARLGIRTVHDLLYHFPFRYEDFSQTVPIANLQEGMQVSVKGKIEHIANKRSPRKRVMITEAIVVDDSDRLRVVWFGQPFIVKQLRVGDTVFLSGKVSADMFGTSMVGPTYEKETRNTRHEIRDTTHTARIVSIYATTTGLTQKQLRLLLKQVIDIAEKIEEWIPQDIRDRADLMPLTEAMRCIHFPASHDELHHAQRRLKFDELFLLQLRAEVIRQSLARHSAPMIPFQEGAIQRFVSSLPFALTKSQKIAAWEIFQDCASAEPMNRLLEGDVGSGKTVIAAMALYNAAVAGFQGVLMAPTEILAKQHYASLTKIFDGMQVRIGLLTGSEFSIFNPPVERAGFQFSSKSQSARKKIVKDRLATGEIDVVIGTHALLQDDVLFANLGLAIVDEQHRFGVAQRKTLRRKSKDSSTAPHFLSMTATPIPRSFALTLYGDLDVSMITEMPPGRKPVKTRVVEPCHRDMAYQFIREQVRQGRQCFVICPLIQTSEKDDVTSPPFYPPLGKGGMGGVEKKSVLAEHEKLSKHIFPDLRVGFVHGKMKPAEKDEVMRRFASGELDVLVSTSVIEVGVNMPNASVMMIEEAARFGLAQLHQFRGRVGRSDHQSYCFLFSNSESKDVQERLSFFEKNTNGFTIAEYDLQRRGPGEVYGVHQSGMMQLKIASMHDISLIKEAREIARGIDFQKFPVLKKRVEKWEQAVHLE